MFLRFSPVYHLPSRFSSLNFPCFCSTIHAILPIPFGEAMQEVEVSAQPFLSATLWILLFSCTPSHFLIISCTPVWSIHGLLYTSGLPCPGKGPFMGPSPSGVVSTSVVTQAALSVGLFLPFCGFIPRPRPSGLSVTQHGFPWTVPPLPNHSSPSMPPYTSLFHSISSDRPLHISLHMSWFCIFLCPLLHLLLLLPLRGLMFILHQCLPPFTYVSKPVHCVPLWQVSGIPLLSKLISGNPFVPFQILS